MAAVPEGRRLASIMFMDMVGYSALMQESESDAITAVRNLWDLVRPEIAAHQGREVDLAGDGMLMEFPGALSAVRCAIKIHAALHERTRGPGANRIRVRAAIHLGDVEHRDGRIYGDGINIAARLLPLCPPGCTVFSPHVRDQLHNVTEMPIELLGTRTLKNIKRPLEIWFTRGPDCSAAELATAKAAARDETPDVRWSFGSATFDQRTFELTVAGKPAAIEKKSLEALLHLLRHAGEVVTKDELLEAVWPGRIISESALTSCMTKLRAALAENADAIKTVHGFGYRLAAPVRTDTAEPVAAPHHDFQAGDHPRHRPLWALVRPLGAGGHGEAWLARHDKTGEERVYKFALDAQNLGSLKREITLSRILAAAPGGLDCFTRVLDWNLEEPPCFIECEFSPGGSLVDWAAAQGGLRQVPLATRIEIAAQVADALATAHSVGVLHKDLKPANILMDAPGAQGLRIRLADFGAGEVLDPQRLSELGITRMGFTRTLLDVGGAAAGTALYIAPEVLAGQPWTSQADIYALGLLLYQLVAGNIQKPLAPGWEADVEDELLREDILAAAAGNPGHRLTDATLLARRLRTLDQRRSNRDIERNAAAAAEQQQRSIAQFKVRRWWTAGLALLLGGVLVASFFLWFDTQMMLMRSMDAMDQIASELESGGNLPPAAALYGEIASIKERQAIGPGFPGALLPPEYALVARQNLARVLVKQNHLTQAREEYRLLLADTRERLGADDPYYAAIAAEYAALLHP